MTGNRWVRYGVIAALVVALVGGVYLVWPGRRGHTVVGYFTSAVGLYPGDDVRVVGVPVGSVESIDPQPDSVKITMKVRDGVKIPADAHAIIMSPNIVAARFVQLTPAYKGGATLADGATIGLDRTAVPVEWDEVKSELTKLSAQLGPQASQMQGLSEGACRIVTDRRSPRRLAHRSVRNGQESQDPDRRALKEQ
jgi:phospholipid/cholesterol/gamma-HCH transport system substrate-binding protein